MGNEEFSWPVRVYYEDTDCAGIVYHASFLRFMERARTEWLRSHGFDLPDLRIEHGVLFTVSRLRIEYLRPAQFNDLLDVGLRLTRFGGASLLLDQNVYRNPRELLCRAEVRIACVDATTMRPRPIPQAVCTELKRDC
ncbi:MAG: tol-pal system-associated acyl-CoA thioesterase [Gammaproteobacteria bacterium]|nr:tol-pal system-associated acyl-CoA thioesterase [Gammaproteobacteria bacterium]NCF83181.1 tol-pal system-associated acyl-CoA thioesterase [Pseudomonadota bacterium]